MTTTLSTLAARVRKLEAKATLGPLTVTQHGNLGWCHLGNDRAKHTVAENIYKDDAHLLALLRNAAPVLAAALEENAARRDADTYQDSPSAMASISERVANARRATDAALAAFEAGQGKEGDDGE